MDKVLLAHQLGTPEVAAVTPAPGDGSNDAVKRGRPSKGAHSPKYDSRIQVKLTPAGRARLDEIVARVDAPGFAEVVRDALAALEANRPLVIPGFPMKLGMFLVRITPVPILRLLSRFSPGRG